MKHAKCRLVAKIKADKQCSPNDPGGMSRNSDRVRCIHERIFILIGLEKGLDLLLDPIQI